MVVFGVNGPKRARIKTVDEFWNYSSLHLNSMWGDYRLFLSLEAIALIIDESNLNELTLVSLGFVHFSLVITAFRHNNVHV